MIYVWAGEWLARSVLLLMNSHWLLARGSDKYVLLSSAKAERWHLQSPASQMASLCQSFPGQGNLGAALSRTKKWHLKGAEVARLCSLGSVEHLPCHVQGAPSASSPGHRQVKDDNYITFPLNWWSSSSRSFQVLFLRRGPSHLSFLGLCSSPALVPILFRFNHDKNIYYIDMPVMTLTPPTPLVRTEIIIN